MTNKTCFFGMSLPKPNPLGLQSSVDKRCSKRLEFRRRLDPEHMLKIIRAIKARYPGVNRVEHKYRDGAMRGPGNICSVRVEGNVAYVSAPVKYEGL